MSSICCSLVHLPAHIYRTHLRPIIKRKSQLRSVYTNRGKDLDFPEKAQDFALIPLEPLPFETIMAVISNDPFLKMERAKFLAEKCESKLVKFENLGHVNSSSNLGEWQDGYNLLSELF